MTSKQEARERRRLEALAAAESRVHERLISLRAELDVIANALDRVTVPRMHAGAGVGLDIGNLVSLSRFRGRR